MSIEGIPEGYELMAIRKATDGETILKRGQPEIWHGAPDRKESFMEWPILRPVPKKLKLEEGKYYKAINGKVFGPMVISHNPEYPVLDDASGKYWSLDGVRYMESDRAKENLVEEVEAPKPPEHRPFASVEEFAPHRDRWIKRKHYALGNSGCWKPQAYHEKGVHTAEGKLVSFTELVEYQFEDGTPCGVKV